jgi:uncharacterized protein involved in exopolysaccharide biosynthesis
VRHARVQLRPIIHALWRDRLLIALCVALAAVASVAYALTRKPLFESEATLASAEKDTSQFAALSGLLGQFGGLANSLGISGSTGAGIDETVTIMQSRDFTLRFLRRNGILPYLFPELWDAQKKTWRIDSQWSLLGPAAETSAAGQVGGTREPSGEKAIERFDLLREVTIDRRTGFIKLAVRARTPELARKWATALISDVNSELRARALAESRRTIELLTEKMASGSHEVVRTTAATLLEGQLKTEVLAQAREDYALRVLDPPSLPEQRWYPKRKRIVILGALAGLLLGVALSLGRHARAGLRMAKERT